VTTKEFIAECCIALDVDPGELDRNSSPDNVKTWDSLGYVSLIAMIDTELGVTIEDDKLQEIETLGHLIDMLKSFGVLE